MKRAVLVAAVAAVLAVPAGTSADPLINYSCSPGSSSCKGWYRQPVSITWTVSPLGAGDCPAGPLDVNYAGMSFSCQATADGVTLWFDRVRAVG